MKNVSLLAQIPEDVLPLVPDFLARRETEITELSSHLQDRDYDFVRMVGHRLKGSGAGYGLMEFTVIGRALEAAALEQKYDAITTLIKELEDHVSLLKTELAAA